MTVFPTVSLKLTVTLVEAARTPRSQTTDPPEEQFGVQVPPPVIIGDEFSSSGQDTRKERAPLALVVETDI